MKRLKRMKDKVLDKVLRRKKPHAAAAPPPTRTRIEPEYQQVAPPQPSMIDTDYSDVGPVQADEAVYNNTTDLQPEAVYNNTTDLQPEAVYNNALDLGGEPVYNNADDVEPEAVYNNALDLGGQGAPATQIDPAYSTTIGAEAEEQADAVYNNALPLGGSGAGRTGAATQIPMAYSSTRPGDADAEPAYNNNGTPFQAEKPPGPTKRQRRAKAMDWETDAQGRLVKPGTQALGAPVAADDLVDPTMASSSYNRDTRGRSEFDEGNDYWAQHDTKVTHRADAADSARYATQVTDTGLMQRGGQALDTTQGNRTAVAGKGWMRQGQMFTMDPSGKLSSADQAAEEAATGKRVHHSTLEAGGDVSAAGELQVRKGRVEAISDRSGHYKPDVTQTHQALSHLAGQGVPLEGMHAVLSGKKAGEGDLNLSAMELHSYGPEMDSAREGASLAEDEEEEAHERNRPERQIRKRHAQKSGMLAQLTDATSEMKRVLDRPGELSKDRYDEEVGYALGDAKRRPQGYSPRYDADTVAASAGRGAQKWQLPDPAAGPNARATRADAAMPSSSQASPWEDEDDEAYQEDRRRRAAQKASRANYM